MNVITQKCSSSASTYQCIYFFQIYTHIMLVFIVQIPSWKEKNIMSINWNLAIFYLFLIFILMAGTLNVPRFPVHQSISNSSHLANSSSPNCHPAQTTEAVVLFSLAVLGMGANIFLMLLILTKKPLRRYILLY